MRTTNLNDRAVVTRAQELIYELRTRAVMTTPTITVAPELPMAELRGILRDNRISGVPVTADGSLVGMISVEDFINWLALGAPPCPVRERMVQSVVTAYADEPLVHAVRAMERHGFGRLPVLERRSGTLVGIVTKGDIIAGLLRAMDVSWREEEIGRYRGGRLLDEMAGDSVNLVLRWHIGHKDVLRGGEVSSRLKASLVRLGVASESSRRAAIATYEAEMNVIIYAEEGDVTVTVDPRTIAIEVRDRGPGIPDVQQAMEPGFSTAPDWVRELGFGAGMGLHNIWRCADTFAIDTDVGSGTCLRIGIPVGAP
ncbi:MAG: hypothetical protein A2177_04140 [Spirochaetes bacterium RBG_13_68_11]|nr:MAG: hypothetical protein A2177_04140 [Spirochaetes bacterium RBG_13_68_11]